MAALTRIFLRIFSTFQAPYKPLVFSGQGSTMLLAETLIASGQRRPLLITGTYLLKKGKLDPVIQKLKDSGCDVTVYSGPKPNPDFTDVEKGLKLMTANNCDSVLAIGGGSVIDTAKVMASASTNGNSVEKMVGLFKVKQPRLPFYVVPTTSGSGSETTIAAVVSEPVHHKKQFFVDRAYIPDGVALDTELLKSLPPRMTAAAGMDAMTHALEAYTSRNSFEDTDKSAAMAIRLLMRYLPRAYEDGEDLEAREMVAQASFLAGYAFTKASLGYVHSISHQLSALYDAPHAEANAVLLPNVMRANQQVCKEAYATLEGMFVGDPVTKSKDTLAGDFIHRIEGLTKALDMPTHIEGLKVEDFDKIAKDARAESRNHAVPKTFSKEEIREILTKVSK